MATNEILPFGTGAGANVMSQAAYAGLADRLNGFGVGVADPTSVNKALRQAAFVATMIAQFTADYGGDALDNGDVPTFEAHFKAALAAWIASGSSPIDLSSYVLRAGDTMTGAFGAPAGFRTTATILSTSTTLTAANFGQFIKLTGTSTTTINMPAPTAGADLAIFNGSIVSHTISTATGVFQGPGSSGTNAESIAAGAVTFYRADGFNWIRVSSTAVPNTSLPKLSFFTTSGTWTKATGASWAFVIAHGPGGGGAGSSAFGTNQFGDGGGAGSWGMSLLSTTGMTTQTVSIGAGGTSSSAGDGADGAGDTSFGSLVIGKPGRGGRVNSSTDANGSKVGAAATGQITGYGSPGFKAGGYLPGMGGAGLFGGAGMAGAASNSRPQGGNGFLGGGGGSSNGGPLAGGLGGDGFVLVLEG